MNAGVLRQVTTVSYSETQGRSKFPKFQDLNSLQNKGPEIILFYKVSLKYKYVCVAVKLNIHYVQFFIVNVQYCKNKCNNIKSEKLASSSFK